MVRKKIDNRIRTLIENGVTLGHRSMFLVVGDRAREQVVLLHHMLSKAEVRARPTVLWCYKKDLGFSSNRKKRMRQLQQKVQAGKLSINEDDPFELFLCSTQIRYCYYSETHKILGNTFGMCVLQDFEALTPNLLARTIETVEGGGLVVILLQSITSLKQLYTVAMDVHQRFRTEAHQDVVCRFNERFLLSLGTNKRCLVMNDQLTVLPISSQNLFIHPVDKDVSATPQEMDLSRIKEQLRDTPPSGAILNCCKTLDQAKALLKFIDTISEKDLRATVSLTAARGRGKSAALGLAVACAVGFGYSNIFVTSPSPENLKTMFEFIFKGFDALQYQEHIDYGLVQSSNPEFNKAIVRVTINRKYRQTIQYIHPTENHLLSQAELLVIDEAAAIPLPHVRKLLGPYLIFMASTINGYEGTGRSLSLKLLEQLRKQAYDTSKKDSTTPAQSGTTNTTSNRILYELSLDESIRYKPGDVIEQWLTSLLCLDATKVAPLNNTCPPPEQCQLFYVNRDTLFCFHKVCEEFLQRIVSLFVSSHYKNSPNDLQMLSDAPAHHLFCLLGPTDINSTTLPDILVVIQVCLEGEISKSSVLEGFSQGKRAAGDLIPWTIGQQFQDTNFPRLSGARIVRIATHPDYQKMGYGRQALTLLRRYYEFEFNQTENTVSKESTDDDPMQSISITTEETDLLTENIKPRSKLPPLLLKLDERQPECLDYLGVSYGLTEPLLRFWKRANFVPVYLRQTANELTGEHSCIMLSRINTNDSKDTVQCSDQSNWLYSFWVDFRERFVNLLDYSFRHLSSALALSIMTQPSMHETANELSEALFYTNFSAYDLKRLNMYGNNLLDFHVVVDLMCPLAHQYFLKHLGSTHLSAAQSVILLGVGLQGKSITTLSSELDLPSAQLLGIFHRIVSRCVTHLNDVRGNWQSCDSGVDSIEPPVAKCLGDKLKLLAAELENKRIQKVKIPTIKNKRPKSFAKGGHASKKTKSAAQSNL